ncbi:MAG: hypothetical protein H7338_09875 [Candidatus Sericytochromatia bacterium]|nr:hypothetical protein [Candidatus Sericytochromatia bacterium]
MRITRWAPLMCAFSLWGCGTPAPGDVSGPFRTDSYLPPSSGLDGYQAAAGGIQPLWSTVTPAALQPFTQSWGFGNPVTGLLPAWCQLPAPYPPFPGPYPPLPPLPPVPFATGFPFYVPPLYMPVYSPLVALTGVPPVDLLAPGISPFAAYGYPGFWPW